jgi:hypothetical protein
LTQRPEISTATFAKIELDIQLRHNQLQAALYSRLVAEFGLENVSGEQATGIGTNIYIVIRHNNGEYWYYEIKTALSPKMCIREAFGQLMEYSYWPRGQEAQRLIVCGERSLDADGQAYLRQIRQRFGVPIDYEQINV